MRQLRKCGATSIEPLFPGETDQELAAIQLVQTKDESAAQRVLKFLETDGAVDYAEREPIRKLMR